MAQTAIDATRSSAMLNANLPVGTAGIPGTQLAALSGAMKLNITSTASTASAAGTAISGTGSGAISSTTASTASSAGSSVTLPATPSPFSWTNGSGSAWNIVSLELTDSTPTRVWYGNWNGQPIAVAIGNTFAVAANAITAGGF